MASTINASNSAGIVQTADTSGVLQLQTASTTAVTIDASQNVGIGTSSPSTLLTLEKANTAYRGQLSINGGSGGISQITLYNGSTTNTNLTGQFYSSFDNVGINLAAPQTTGYLSFQTNGNTERMRIDSSGNLLVGNTVRYSTEKASIYSASGTDYGLLVQNLGGSANHGIRAIIGGAGNNTSTYHFQGTTNGVNNWFLYGNGTTSYSSDERLKKNIETARNGYLDDLVKLRVVKYNWLQDEEQAPKELGLIAQEVEQVFPNLIQEHELEGVGIRKNIKHSVMEFILIKAIQEQQELIVQLQADVAALKGTA